MNTARDGCVLESWVAVEGMVATPLGNQDARVARQVEGRLAGIVPAVVRPAGGEAEIEHVVRGRGATRPRTRG